MAIYDALARFMNDADVDALTANTWRGNGDVIDRAGNVYAQYPSTDQLTDIGDGMPVYATFIFGDGWDGGSAAYVLDIGIGTSESVTSNHIDTSDTGFRVLAARSLRFAGNTEPSEGDTYGVVLSPGVDTQRYVGFVIRSSVAFTDGNTGSMTSFLSLVPPTGVASLYVEGRNWV